MIFKTLWERYLLRETLKVLILFLASFYFLYILLDYSMHMQEIIKGKTIPITKFTTYYVVLLSKRFSLLLPLSLLIATLRVLCSLNTKNELLAFQAGGISLKQMMRPFLFLSFISMCLCTLNSQYIIPDSHSFLYRFQREYFHTKKTQKKEKKGVRVMPLKDGSRLIFQSSGQDPNELFDVYWLLSADEFWHINTLSLKNDIPFGTKAEYLYRNEKGLIEKGISYPSLPFETMQVDFNLKYLLDRPMENLSITQLYAMHKEPSTLFQKNENTILSHLYYKLLLPWLSFFVVIGAAPFAVRFSREMSPFLIFAVAIFGYIALFTILGASLIIGEGQVVHPFWALFTVPLLALLYFGKKFLKMG